MEAIRWASADEGWFEATDACCAGGPGGLSCRGRRCRLFLRKGGEGDTQVVATRVDGKDREPPEFREGRHSRSEKRKL